MTQRQARALSELVTMLLSMADNLPPAQRDRIESLMDQVDGGLIELQRQGKGEP